MAIQLVGYTTGGGTGASYTVSLNGTLTGGIASSPATGDYVVVACGHGDTVVSAPTVTGDNTGSYGALHAAQRANDTWDANFLTLAAFMGGSVDTQLTIGRANNTAYGGACVVTVWRGVDTGSPMDVAATTATGTNASTINPPAIQPSTAGCVILAGGAGCQTTGGSTFTGPSNLTATGSAHNDGTTSDTGTILGWYTGWTSGSFDPNPVTGGTTSTSSSWAAATMALRPAPDSATGTLDAAETGSDTFETTGGTVAWPASTGTLDAAETGSDTFETTGGSLGIYLRVSWIELDIQAAGVITGTLDATETGSDTFATTGGTVAWPASTGTLDAAETGSDTFATTGGAVGVAGSLDAAETGSDTFATTGGTVAWPARTGTMDAAETGADVAEFSGLVTDPGIIGTLAAAETGSDTFETTGGVVVVAGSVAATEIGSDTFATTGGAVGVAGSLDAAETGADTFAASGTVAYPGITGILLVQESGSDLLEASGGILVSGYLDTAEVGSDTFEARPPLAIPVLSSPTVIEVYTRSVRPRVTVTY